MWFDSKNWIFLLNMTLRIKPSFLYMSLFIEPYSHFDSKNWTFSIFENFFNRIYRFAPFSSGLKELNWISKIWLKELNLFWNLTQWIAPSAQKDSKNWTQKDYLTPTTKLFLWLEELNVLFYFIQRIEPFSKISLKLLDFFKMTHRIKLLTTWHYSQNWTLFN